MLWVLSLEPFTQIQSKPAQKARFLPGIWSMFVALLHCSIYGWLSVFAPFPQRVSSFSSYPASSKVFSCMNECSGSINWLRRKQKKPASASTLHVPAASGVKGLKKRQTQTDRQKSWTLVDRALSWRKHNTPEARRVYYGELNREVGLLNPDKQGDGICGVQLNQGDAS